MKRARAPPPEMTLPLLLLALALPLADSAASSAAPTAPPVAVAVAAAAGRRPTVAPSSSSPCTDDWDCPSGLQHCSSADATTTGPSTCAPCWRCCMRAASAASTAASTTPPCPPSCACAPGAACGEGGLPPCGAGLFCAASSLTCRSCAECLSDADAAGGAACAAACPSGALGGGSAGGGGQGGPLLRRQREDAAVLAFEARDLFGEGDDDAAGWTPDEFGRWWWLMQQQQQQGKGEAELRQRATAAAAFAAVDGGGAKGDGRVTRGEWVAAGLARPREQWPCFGLESLDANASEPTFAGCPCSLGGAPPSSASPAQRRCPAGHACLALLDASTTTTASGVCVPCAEGQLCPEGTTSGGSRSRAAKARPQPHAPAAALSPRPWRASALECPAGSYCPTPAAALPCPAGSFCPRGSSAPVECPPLADAADAAGSGSPSPLQLLLGSRGRSAGGGSSSSKAAARLLLLSRYSPWLAALTATNGGSSGSDNSSSSPAADNNPSAPPPPLQPAAVRDYVLSGAPYCPANSNSPLRGGCPAGSFCPTPAGPLERCPRGSYCPPGTAAPRACRPLAPCPEGTSKPRFSGMAVVVVIGALTIAGLWWRLLLWWEARELAAALAGAGAGGNGALPTSFLSSSSSTPTSSALTSSAGGGGDAAKSGGGGSGGRFLFLRTGGGGGGTTAGGGGGTATTTTTASGRHLLLVGPDDGSSGSSAQAALADAAAVTEVRRWLRACRDAAEMGGGGNDDDGEDDSSSSEWGWGDDDDDDDSNDSGSSSDEADEKNSGDGGGPANGRRPRAVRFAPQAAAAPADLAARVSVRVAAGPVAEGVESDENDEEIERLLELEAACLATGQRERAADARAALEERRRRRLGGGGGARAKASLRPVAPPPFRLASASSPPRPSSPSFSAALRADLGSLQRVASAVGGGVGVAASPPGPHQQQPQQPPFSYPPPPPRRPPSARSSPSPSAAWKRVEQARPLQGEPAITAALALQDEPWALAAAAAVPLAGPRSRWTASPPVAVAFDIHYLCRGGGNGGRGGCLRALAARATSEGRDGAAASPPLQQQPPPGAQVVLGPMRGVLPPGTTTAVLGPSGCGKSTFLDVLRGQLALRPAPLSPSSSSAAAAPPPPKPSAGGWRGVGRVEYGGVPLGPGLPMHLLVGFVPQDDLVHPDLTVRENLLYAAALTGGGLGGGGGATRGPRSGGGRSGGGGTSGGGGGGGGVFVSCRFPPADKQQHDTPLPGKDNDNDKAAKQQQERRKRHQQHRRQQSRQRQRQQQQQHQQRHLRRLERQVDDALSLLALAAPRVQHSPVGCAERRGVSGGERRRVSIGAALVARPSCLLLDEPTSGLDAAAAMAVASALRAIAARGVAVAAVLHQPRFALFAGFGQALLLDPDPRTATAASGGGGGGGGGAFLGAQQHQQKKGLAFAGPPALAAPYFEAALGFRRLPGDNPADWLLDALGGAALREGGGGFGGGGGIGGSLGEGHFGVAYAPSARVFAAVGGDVSGPPPLALAWRAAVGAGGGGGESSAGEAWVASAARRNRAVLGAAARRAAARLSPAALRWLQARVPRALPDARRPHAFGAAVAALAAGGAWGGGGGGGGGGGEASADAAAAPAALAARMGCVSACGLSREEVARVLAALLQLSPEQAAAAEAQAALSADEARGGGGAGEDGSGSGQSGGGKEDDERGQPGCLPRLTARMVELSLAGAAGLLAAESADDAAAADASAGGGGSGLVLPAWGSDDRPASGSSPSAAAARRLRRARRAERVRLAVLERVGFSTGGGGAMAATTTSAGGARPPARNTATALPPPPPAAPQPLPLASLPSRLPHLLASACRRARWLLARALLRRRRQWTSAGGTLPAPLLDLCLLLAAGLACGAVHAGKWDVEGAAQRAAAAMTALGVLCCAVHLRPLCTGRPVLAREARGGVAPAAAFAAGAAAEAGAVLVGPLAFVGAYWWVALPEASFGAWYAAALGVAWWASGLAHLVAAATPSRSALVAAVFLALIFGAFLNGAVSPMVATSRRVVPGTFEAHAEVARKLVDGRVARMTTRGERGVGVGAPAEDAAGGGNETKPPPARVAHLPLAAVLAVSYNRWATEAVGIAELRAYGRPPAHRAAALAAARAWGACAVDLALPSLPPAMLGQDAALEALPRLRALYSTWYDDGDGHGDGGYFCAPWRARALGVLAAGGALLRFAAAAVLSLTWRAAWWSGG